MLELGKSYLEKHYELEYLQYMMSMLFDVYKEGYDIAFDDKRNRVSFILDFTATGVILYLESFYWDFGDGTILEYIRDIYGLDMSRAKYKAYGIGGVYSYDLSYAEVDSIYVLSYMKLGSSGSIEDDFVISLRYGISSMLAEYLSHSMGYEEFRIGSGGMNKTVVYTKDLEHMNILHGVLYKYLPSNSYSLDNIDKKAKVWKYRCIIELSDKDYIGVIHMIEVKRNII